MNGTGLVLAEPQARFYDKGECWLSDLIGVVDPWTMRMESMLYGDLTLREWEQRNWDWRGHYSDAQWLIDCRKDADRFLAAFRAAKPK